MANRSESVVEKLSYIKCDKHFYNRITLKAKEKIDVSGSCGGRGRIPRRKKALPPGVETAGRDVIRVKQSGEMLFLFLFALFNNLFGNWRRRLFVVIEFHDERALAAGHGTQVRGVAQHFAHGHVGLDFRDADR